MSGEGEGLGPDDEGGGEARSAGARDDGGGEGEDGFDGGSGADVRAGPVMLLIQLPGESLTRGADGATNAPAVVNNFDASCCLRPSS